MPVFVSKSQYSQYCCQLTGIVKYNGPVSQFLPNRDSYIIHCQMLQLLLCNSSPLCATWNNIGRSHLCRQATTWWTSDVRSWGHPLFTVHIRYDEECIVGSSQWTKEPLAFCFPTKHWDLQDSEYLACVSSTEAGNGIVFCYTFLWKHILVKPFVITLITDCGMFCFELL